MLLTPKPQGFATTHAVPVATAAAVVPKGIADKQWKAGNQVITAADWKTKNVEEQMDMLLGGRWSIWLNDSFILGGIHGHRTFYLVSDISDYGNPDDDFTFNVTQRELIGLVTFGYSRGEPTARGAEYKCTNTVLADGASFRAYVDQMKTWVAAVRS